MKAYRENRRKHRALRVALAAALAMLLVLAGVGTAYAYWSLPGVSVTPSAGSVSLASGQSQSIGVSVSPMEERQLPGCGMAECPQTCPPECIDEGGWCVCGGLGWVTYQTSVSVSSSNSSVAQASFGGGVLTVTGVSPGSATITVTASLAKHTDSSASVGVTVAAPASAAPPTETTPQQPANSGGSSNAGSPSGGASNSNSSTAAGGGTNSTGGTSSTSSSSGGSSAGGTGVSSGESSSKTDVTGTAGTGKTTPETKKEDLSEAGAEAGSGTDDVPETNAVVVAVNPVQCLTGRDGKNYTIVTLGLDADLGSIFKGVYGKDEKVVVQSKNAAGNVEYSLSFTGTDMAEDDVSSGLKLDGGVTGDLPEGVRAHGDALRLRFDEHAPLPAVAEVYMAVGDGFGASAPTAAAGLSGVFVLNAYAAEAGAGDIDVYQADPVSGELTKIAQGGSVVNGYVVFDIDNTNDVVIARGALDAPGLSAGKSGFPAAPAAVIVIVAAAAAAALLLARRFRAAAGQPYE